MPEVAASSHSAANRSDSATRSQAVSSSTVHGLGRLREVRRCSRGRLACSAGLVDQVVPGHRVDEAPGAASGERS